MATRDTLTGLCNRNHFMELYEKKAAESTESGEPMSVILMDIDHFKLINDVQTSKGDYVLQEIADILTRNIRISDTICIWGGEFLILCPHTDREKDRHYTAENRMNERHEFESVN